VKSSTRLVQARPLGGRRRSLAAAIALSTALAPAAAHSETLPKLRPGAEAHPTEIGYTTRPDPAVRPWEWPDTMKGVRVNERAQADVDTALIAPLLDARWCAGFFIWRTYADPDAVSQEAEWGFPPRGKLAELVVRDAFTARWAVDGPRLLGAALDRHRARTPGIHAWEMAPEIEFFP
jgi:hypothetical protein